MKLGSILFWGYLLFLVYADGTVNNAADPDLWHRLATGEYIVQSGGNYPPREVFSYLADQPEILDHEAGSALIFYPIYALGGQPLIILFKLLLLAMTLIFTVQSALLGRKISLLLAGFYALVLLVLLPSFNSTIRCMQFTHVFFAFWVYLWARERYARALPWWLYPFTMGLWANLHGGFILGFIWLGMLLTLDFLQGRDWRSRGLVLISCLLASLLNPIGWKIWLSVYKGLFVSRAMMLEWQPVNWLTDDGFAVYKIFFLIGLILVTLHAMRYGWQGSDMEALVLLAGIAALSLSAHRHTSLLAIAGGAILPGLIHADEVFTDLSETLNADLQRLAAFAAGSFMTIIPLYLIFQFFPGDGLHLKYTDDSCPVAAVNYLKTEGVTGRLLIPFNYGSYALWQLRGQMRVSMDGRYEILYTNKTSQMVSDFFADKNQGPDGVHPPPCDRILLSKTAPIYPKLTADSHWQQVYADKINAIFKPVQD